MSTSALRINYKSLIGGVSKVLAEHDGTLPGKRGAKRRAAKLISEAMDDPSVRASFDLGQMFAQLIGYQEFAMCRSDRSVNVNQVMEAAGGVSSDAFLTITQQFIYSTVIPKYELPDFIFKAKIPTVPSPFRFEMIPGVSNIGDEATVVLEGDEFPYATPAEDIIRTPTTRKRGLQIPITKEAIFFDRTGLVVTRCSEVGESLGVNREKRAINCIIDAGETPTAQYRYQWRGESTGLALTSIATYGANSGDHTWDNLATSNGLEDYNQINIAWQLLVAMTDPFTGLPIGSMFPPKDIIIPPSLVFQTPFSIGGQVRRMAPGYATSGNPTQTQVDASPTEKNLGQLNVMWSQLLQQQMTAAGIAANAWWLGDISKAFRYMENWPMTVEQLGTGTQAEFSRDIVQQFKCSEQGSYATVQPRAVIENTP
jgi:hypothetical protein